MAKQQGLPAGRLLSRACGRELAIADAKGKTLDEFGYRVFAVGSDQLGEGREQAGLRQAIAIDAIVSCFRPGFAEVAEGGLLLFLIGQQVAGDEGRWMVHELTGFLHVWWRMRSVLNRL